MDDLISRQAAIDAVCEHGTELERRGIMVLAVANHKQVTVDLLESLPSAQPEVLAHGEGELFAQSEITHCKDCIWRNVYRFTPKYDERDYCDKHEKTVGTDGFCSWAERRSDGE